MLFTETMLTDFAQPLSQTEDQRCRNAINMIRDALKSIGYTTPYDTPQMIVSDSHAYMYELAHSEGRRVKLMIQGSYANNTNVRQNSDVDIAVILESTFTAHYRNGVTGRDYGYVDSADNLTAFKDDVERVLQKYFVTGVERKKKSIKVHGNSYRVDADTVPCMRFRDYTKDYSNNPKNYVGGIKIVADDGEVIYNYPEQHIINGKDKNIATNHLYKKMVRIMKKMRYLMEDQRIASASMVSSFALESLLWNVSNSWYLSYGTYRKVYAFDRLIDLLQKSQNNFGDYFEANGIKPLCPTQKSKENLISFLSALRNFYQYE